MKTIKVFFSGVAVYLSVASIHACSIDSMPTSATSSSASGGAGGATMIATSSSGSGGKGAGGGMMNPVHDALAESGSRLKAQWLVGEDGSKFFAGTYDSKRKEDCVFLPMTDGKRRCAPLSSSVRLYDAALVVPEYIDPSCASRVVSFVPSTCKADPLYAHVIADASCPTYDFVTLVLVPTPPTVYHKIGNTCVSAPTTTKTNYYLADAHIAPSEFVAASIVTDP